MYKYIIIILLLLIGCNQQDKSISTTETIREKYFSNLANQYYMGIILSNNNKYIALNRHDFLTAKIGEQYTGIWQEK